MNGLYLTLNQTGKTMKKITALTLATALATSAAPALAQSQGDMTLGLGLAGVFPTSSASATTAGAIDVDENYRPTLTFEYFVADNIGLEVLAAWPFEHDFNLNGAKVGKTKHLPPTISVNYHFTNKSAITPFVGLGVNYTTFWDETGTGALAGVPISLDDSWGLAVNAGLDYAISDKSAIRANLRWIDINTDATVNGAPIGKVEIDPWVVNVAYVFKF